MIGCLFLSIIPGASFAFNNSGNRGIACHLNNLQKWEDGEPLHESARKMMIQELGLDASREFPEAVGKSSSGFWRQVVEKFHLDGDPNDFEKRQYQYVAMQIKEKR